MWHAHALLAIHAAQLEDLLTGHDVKPTKTVQVIFDGKDAQQPNPAYAKWAARDQSGRGL
jgi:hypothetical protein